MAELYRISTQRMKGLADQARRLGKVNVELTPGQIEETLRGVPAGEEVNPFHMVLTDEIANHIVSDDAAFVPGGVVEDVTTPATLTGPMCHYADTLLPGIPADILEKYPYVFIRKNGKDKIYDLGFSKTGYFVDDKPAVEVNGYAIMPRYSFPLGFTTETVWTNTYNVSYTGWTIDDNRIPLWANCDIPNGSADSAEIYLPGSEPEPLGKFYYNGVLLPGMARNNLAEYPYCLIRRNSNTGNYDLLMSDTPWYLLESETISRTAGKDVVWYVITIDSASTSERWTFSQTHTSVNWGDDAARPVIWSSHDVPNGSVDATEIYFAGSEPVPAEQEG